MGFNLNVISKRSKSACQEVQGVIVMPGQGGLVFNFNTARDPVPIEMELLKNFRNNFMAELDKLNEDLAHLPK